MEKIAVVTDARRPQINGVVTTLGLTIENLRSFGYEVTTINPQLFKSIPCPSYPEISLSITGVKGVGRKLSFFKPHCIDIATEGPLGWAALLLCKSARFDFSTSYHTRFPEYVRMRWPVTLSVSYGLACKFHQAASRTMVATSALKFLSSCEDVNKTL